MFDYCSKFIKKIYKKWNVDIKKSFMIGDKKTDKIAAKKSKFISDIFGVKSLLLF